MNQFIEKFYLCHIQCFPHAESDSCAHPCSIDFTLSSSNALVLPLATGQVLFTSFANLENILFKSQLWHLFFLYNTYTVRLCIFACIACDQLSCLVIALTGDSTNYWTYWCWLFYLFLCESLWPLRMIEVTPTVMMESYFKDILGASQYHWIMHPIMPNKYLPSFNPQSSCTFFNYKFWPSKQPTHKPQWFIIIPSPCNYSWLQ